MSSLTLGPAVVDLFGIRAGDQNLITFLISRDGVPVDLTGQTVTAQARKTTLAVEALDAVVEVTDVTGGRIRLRWPGEEVRTWLAGKAVTKGVWDLQTGNGVDDPLTLVAGVFEAVQDVTRP